MPPKKDVEAKEVKAEAVEAVEEKPVVVVDVEDVAPKAVLAASAPPEVVMTFDRWFGSQKDKKPHWKAGMKAYANTNGRRTASAWASLFKNY